MQKLLTFSCRNFYVESIYDELKLSKGRVQIHQRTVSQSSCHKPIDIKRTVTKWSLQKADNPFPYQTILLS